MKEVVGGVGVGESVGLWCLVVFGKAEGWTAPDDSFKIMN
jgi:hypothetical protein